jgi:hypothetical protein
MKCEWEMKLQNFQMFKSSSTIVYSDSINKYQCNHVLSVSINKCQCNEKMMSI